MNMARAAAVSTSGRTGETTDSSAAETAPPAAATGMTARGVRKWSAAAPHSGAATAPAPAASAPSRPMPPRAMPSDW